MRRVWWMAAAVAVASCTDNTGPGVPSTQLNFVLQDTLAPALVATRDSFYAKVSDGRELRLFYQGSSPSDSGDEFLRFEVPGDGLYRKPDGSAFQPGDSILITVTVIDPVKFVFQFEPAGLQFDPSHPAVLRVHYLHCDHDFNGDGVEDSSDDEIETELGLWYQATDSAPWYKMGSVKFEELDEIEANIRSFSHYALAW